MSAVLKVDRWLFRETLTSVIVSAVLSGVAFLLTFRGMDAIPAWGVGNLAFDALAQSLATVFMASLAPGLLGWKLIASGRIANIAVPAKSRLWVVARSVVSGIVAAAGGYGIWAAGLSLADAVAVPSGPALVLKMVYGSILSGLATWLLLRELVGSRLANAPATT